MDLNDVDFDEDLGIKKEEANEKLVKPKKEIIMWVKAVEYCKSLISSASCFGKINYGWIAMTKTSRNLNKLWEIKNRQIKILLKGNLCSAHFVTYTWNLIILHIFSPSETLSTGWEKYQNDSQEESVTEVKVDTSELPLVTSSNGEQVLRFYWLDAYEDPYSSPGTFTVKVWNQETFVDIPQWRWKQIKRGVLDLSKTFTSQKKKGGYSDKVWYNFAKKVGAPVSMPMYFMKLEKVACTCSSEGVLLNLYFSVSSFFRHCFLIWKGLDRKSQSLCELLCDCKEYREENICTSQINSKFF